MMRTLVRIARLHALPVLALAVLAVAGLTAAATPAFAEAQQPIDRELDKYWNVEQAVPSLQNALFERKGGFEASIHGGLIPNDSYYVPLAVGGRAAFFFTDSISVEGGFSYLMGSDSDLQAFLKCAGKAKGRCIDLTDGSKKAPHLTMLASLDLAFTPFHGKLGIFTSKISNFDLGISGGLGIINADIDTSSDGIAPPGALTKVGGHWGAGFRFYFSRWLNLRMDYKQFLYVPESGKGFLAPVEFTLGLAFLTK